MKRITVTLRRGKNAYNTTLGTPRQLLRVVPVAANMVGVVLLVDPNQPGEPCSFFCAGNLDTLPDDAGSHLGSANDLDVFSTCFQA